jgi:anion-transporting  ArsA/GET3 family ATPase
MKQQIHFVTGKGGVGKSLVAAALALQKSLQGQRVLLVELGEQSFFQDFYGLEAVNFAPQQIRKNLSLALWKGEEALRDYAKYLVKVESLVKLFFENPVMSSFINVAPALRELAILGKVTSGPRQHGPVLPFDCLVVDCFATGHFLALLEAPRGMAQAIQFGPMGEQSRSILATIQDLSICQYHIVTLPEELPARESLELKSKLESSFQIKSDILLNKVIRTSLQAKDLPADGDLFVDYLRAKLTHQADILQRLQKEGGPVRVLPWIYESDPWVLTEKLMETL